jgi:oligopeptide transport system ATP-binding protein
MSVSRVDDIRRPLLAARNIVQEFSLGRDVVRALSGVSFEIESRETLGVVGESGSGKSTLARSILQIPKPKSGSVWFKGQDLSQLKGRRLVECRRGLQMVFQDVRTSLNPRWHVSDIVEEPLIGYKVRDRAHRKQRVADVLDLVGLPAGSCGRKRPQELSGGECQRVNIARALALEPELIVCDEAVSSLDVLVQAQILSLLQQLRSELGLSYLFISHDLAVVRRISERVAVLYMGQLCEIARTDLLFSGPLHPYTATLLASIPGSAPTHLPPADSVEEAPSPIDPPSGCRFRTRCRMANAQCALAAPPLRQVDDGHFVACHFPLRRAAVAGSTA